MADCNIRNIDDALLTALKVKAASKNVYLREEIIAALRHWLLTDPCCADITAAAMVDEPPIKWANMYADAARTFRPKHAIDCKCFICKPPKESK